MKIIVPVLLAVIFGGAAMAQVTVDVSGFDHNNGATVQVNKNLLTVTWPAANEQHGQLVINLQNAKPLFKSIALVDQEKVNTIANDLDPVFLLTVGKRDLISQNGWNIFFDKTNKLPHQSYKISCNKKSARVISAGSRTIITVGQLTAASFTGNIEITLYNKSALMNIAAVMATSIDSTAILYDAGLISKGKLWQNIHWINTSGALQNFKVIDSDTSENIPVKYRTLVAGSDGGSLAVFPAPHQYFYPLDEAFNLRFTWLGKNYRNMVPEYGIGIRQDLMGDNRWVPWFNAPPGTAQRLNFFCLLGDKSAANTLDEVKQYTHNDRYKPLDGYKTMSSHFHNEYVMNVIMPGKDQPGIPAFVNVFKQTGIDIVHLAEFHYTAHPKGPDEQRLKELKALFELCGRSSGKDFLLLPGEEPNEFFGGHWLDFFPKPVYWIMDRKQGVPMISEEPGYEKVYRISNKEEMLQLLEEENGLAWTAHARTKGSTGFPDQYKDEPFYKSDHFFGAAWKSMPADLSQPRLGKRVLDLMDDMANWGYRKHVIGEADLFSVTPENEMYAHLNVNYLQLAELPDYTKGWQSVLDAMQAGKFFVSTGEVLLPSFTVNGKGAGETITLNKNGDATVEVSADWTFPLNFGEVISGDGEHVFREKISLENTTAFGKNKFTFPVNLKNRIWVRFELWDVAANGAFTQQVWIEK